MEGATVEEFADGLEEPSGIALHDGRLFVSDHGTNEIVAYDLASGEELARIQTDAVGIMGLEFGPDGKLYFADGDGNEIVRIDPAAE
jgi:glucose/arabinose dehydrogenase